MKYKFTLLCLFLFWSVFAFAQQSTDIDKAFSHAESQTKLMLQEIEDTTRHTRPQLVVPRTLTSKGNLRLVSSRDWTSGFFPGNLWFLYEHTQDPYWLTKAQAFTAKIDGEQYDSTTHDVGFKVYNSFGTGYRLTQNAHYRKAIIQAAKTLSTRFNAKTGCIESWDHSTRRWDYPVIIDNMMNLELLFTATRLTGDSTYYKIAVSHANTTLKNHFRKDYSSWHVVDYDTATGAVLKKTTAQGYSDSSAWARGQAWGLYGYTMCYRETKNQKYLKHAENIAAYILNHPNLPTDGVAYWDFNAPKIPNEPRDASAAAVMASALYELSTYSSNKTTFLAAADKLLYNLANLYNSPLGQNHGFILIHSTGNKPGNTEVDVPLVYADYYYLEALIRRKQINIPPQIKPISRKSVTIGKTLRFVVAATDSNTNQTQIFSLLKAPKGARIDKKTGKFTWTPKQVGTFTFRVRVTDNGSPILTSEKPITIKVNPVKLFTLQVTIVGNGIVTRDPMQNTYAEGTEVKLTATPATGFQFDGWSGDVTATTATLPIKMNSNKQVTAKFSLIPPQVIKLNLINADNNNFIINLKNDITLDLAKLPTKNLTIEANLNMVTTKSVVFDMIGELNHQHVESGSPYVLFGDIKGNPKPWTPAEGQYTLKATPYSELMGAGTPGKSLTFNFKVINSGTNNLARRATADNYSENKQLNLVVYPNPTNTGQVTVHLPTTFKGNLNFTLFSLVGAKLAEGTYNLVEPGKELAFDFSRQMSATGVYYLNVESPTAKGVIKLVRN